MLCYPNGELINLRIYVEEIVEFLKTKTNKVSEEKVFYIVKAIQTYCFREMQALQIVKLEYTTLSHDELKQKVRQKLEEEYIPIEEYNNGNGITEQEMLNRVCENDQFIENCIKLQNHPSPL